MRIRERHGQWRSLWFLYGLAACGQFQNLPREDEVCILNAIEALEMCHSGVEPLCDGG